jgi:hypothetical protein
MKRLDRLFSTVGDGSGVSEMAALPASYFITPGANELMEISRILLYMQDDAKFAGEKYTGGGALSNGIIITKESSGVVVHTYTPQPIKVIGHWGLLAGVDVVLTDFTSGNDFFLVRWTLSKADHQTTLDGTKGEYLRVRVRDSLVAAVSHIMSAQGTVEWCTN